MKQLLHATFALMIVALLGCQSEKESTEENTDGKSEVTQVSNQIVEAACGECKFEMKGSSCDLAVRIDGKSYFVDGSSIDDHGDAHGEDGMCMCIRKAKVSGEIKDGRFVATSFEVLPMEDKNSNDEESNKDENSDDTK